MLLNKIIIGNKYRGLPAKYGGPEQVISIICEGNQRLKPRELQSQITGLLCKPISFKSPRRSSSVANSCTLKVLSWFPETSKVVFEDLGTGKNRAGGIVVKEVFTNRINTSGPINIINKTIIYTSNKFVNL